MDNYDSSYYLISTDSDYMSQIGLSAFTSGQLYQWWNQQDERVSGVFPNRELISGVSTFDDLTSLFLGGSEEYNISLWDNEQSEFVVQNVMDSSFSIQGKTAPLTSTDIGINDYGTLHFMYKEIGDNNDYVAKPIDVATGPPTLAQSKARMIVSTIEHNNLIRLKYTQEGRSPAKWEHVINIVDKNGDSLGYPQLSIVNAQAKSAYVNAIKSSRDTCMSWKVSVPFIINLNSLGTCVFPQDVTFKLRLFDNMVGRSSNRGISFFNGNQPIVGTPHNLLGQRGISDAGNMALPKRDVVAGLDMYYDEHVGKFRSGTKQMIGFIVDTIGPYTNPDPEIETIDGADQDAVLKLIKRKNIPQGEAYPVITQNGNSNIWSIPFKNPSSCRTEQDKVKVKVLNFASKTFSPKQRVMLTNIFGSYWVPQDFGEPEPTKPVYNFGDNWQFTSLIMNRDNYFRKLDLSGNTDTTAQFSTEVYEAAFAAKYYYHMGIYYGIAPNVNPEYVRDANLNSPAANTFLPSTGQILHITSFDFLAKNIGGTRGGKHGVAQTNFFYDYQGQALTNNGKGLDGFQTQFFGALFPNGYSVSKDAKLTTDARVLKAKDTDGSYFDATYYAATGASTDIAPFAGGVNANTTGGNDGMFDAGAIAAGYVHLPADVATVTKDSILNMKSLREGVAFQSDFYNTVGLYLDRTEQRFSGLVSLNGTTESKPFGDITPTSKGRVQFRPLAMENFAQYEADVSLERVSRFPGGIMSPSFGSKARNKVTDFADNGGTYSKKVLTRGGIDSAHPIRYGSSVQGVNIGLSNDQSVGCKFKTVFSGQDGYNFDIFSPTKFNSEPPYAIGVIAATCEASFNTTSFPITTESYIGMAGKVIQGGGSAGSVTVIGGDFWSNNDGANAYRNEYKFWGTTANTKNFQSTELWMKIYTHHPRELTIFDPRFFSVHHFQSGVDKLVHNGHPITQTWYIHGVKATDAAVISCKASNPKLADDSIVSVATLDPNTSYGVYDDPCVPYLVDDSEVPSVDYHVPTWSNAPINPPDPALSTQTDNTIIPTGVNLYKNSPVRKIADSRIEPKRRGKLLPFKYYRKGIGVPTNLSPDQSAIQVFFGYNGGYVLSSSYNNALFTYNAVTIENATPTNTAKDYDFVIADQGTGYKQGQKFTTRGGSGGGVVLRAIVRQGDTTGKIAGFVITDPGQGFAASDFLNSTDLLATVKGGVFVIPDTTAEGADLATGTGFVGFFTRGQVYDFIQTDAAPKKSKGETLISPDTNGGGVIDQTKTNTIQLEDDGVASDNKYDLFFHFHNDCQHTMFYAPDYQSTSPTHQQHITVSLGG